MDLLGSQTELQSAASNLVSNAIRYTPGGGSIDVRLQVPLLLGDHLDVRMVDGTVARPGRDVQRELDGADVVLLLGSTELSHTVSSSWAGPKTVATNQRGISGFLLEAAEKIRDRAARAGR